MFEIYFCFWMLCVDESMLQILIIYAARYYAGLLIFAGKKTREKYIPEATIISPV